ncbi:MAG: radical SAM protein [Dorea sp.]|nr:radical SAM protein [Dorea sp.]
MDIAVWGAGKFGQFVIRQLVNRSNVVVKYIIDKRADELKEVLGIPVVSPEKYRNSFAKNVEIVLVAFVNSLVNIKELKSLEIKKLGIVSDLAYKYSITLSDNIFEDRQIIWGDTINGALPFLPILETNVVDYCNLNCKGCSHFSNLFPKGSKVAFETFKKDIQCLSQEINIIQFNLLGGEALLSDELEDYIRCLTEYMPATRIQLVTNGILIPKQSPDRLHFFEQNNVYISITEYPPTAKMKEEIIKTMNQYGIHFEMRQLVSTFGKNIDISGENNAWEAQRTCRESKCHFLREGKIYKCPFSALGNYFFKYYHMPLHFDEGIDIHSGENDWKKIINELDEKPIEQCRFCGAEERFSWAVSTNPEKEEWII